MGIDSTVDRGSRGRVVMLVDNPVAGDSRVQKTARSMAAAGWDVTLLGCGPEPGDWWLGAAQVRVLGMGGGGSGGGVRGRLLSRGGLPLRLARLARRPLERAQVLFWKALLGDRAWRRLEPGLWNYERVFGPVIDELRPDLLHAHDFRMLGVAARAASRSRAAGHPAALVWDAHEFLPGARPRRDNARWLPAHLAYEREYVPDADAVVTVSDELAGLLRDEHHLPGRPLVVLNAPAVDPPIEPVPDLRALCGIDRETPLLVYAGSATPQRGLDTAVRALSELDGVHLALVVADPHAAYVRTLTAHDRVHAVPYVPPDQVPAFLSTADAGLIPIHHWPNHEIALITKFFEYSHARLPIVVSDVRTMAATVRATGQGEVFRAEDPADLARAVRAVLADPDRYRAAYDRPDSPLPGWTWEAQAAKLDQLYKGLLRQRAEPDVTVIVPVYNTMPYLTECLDSLTGQSIGLARMRIVTVDDGSTDSSGAELARYARRYSGTVTVLHQENSGGPAGPCNRALDVATGRYVFFVGADDKLGPEALERLVAFGDTYGSDVVLGKVLGVHSRHIYQDIFARNAIDVDLFDSPLPRSLANTKLFRRDLLERHGIRYREDMPIGSDLPFTLEACLRAGRISVLADYVCYYAIRRFSATNITYLSRHALRVRTVEQVMAFVAGLIEPGPRRDAILVHRFDHEVARLLEDDLLHLDRETQQLVHDGLGKLVAEHLSPEIAARLGAEPRIRMALTRDGSLDDLLAAIRRDAADGVPPTVTRDGRKYAAYPGFGTLPDACFDVTDSADWPVKLDATDVRWSGRELVITARSPSLVGDVAVSAEEVPGRVTPVDSRAVESGAVDFRADGSGAGGTTLRIGLRAGDLLAVSGPSGQRRIVSAQPGPFDPDRALGAVSATGAAGAAAVRAPGVRVSAKRLGFRGGRPYLITPVLDPSGRLMISVVPITAKRLAARLGRAVGR